MTSGTDRLKKVRWACKAIGLEDYSTDRFVARAMEWLAQTHGDVHVEYHRDVGWGVSCCYEDKSWDGWIFGATLSEALATAVLES